MDDEQLHYDGFVYLLTNPSFKNQAKIGFSKNPNQRVAQLNTGSPTDFWIHCAWGTTDVRRAESICHRMLAKDRVHPRREFFHVPPQIETWIEIDAMTGGDVQMVEWPLDDLADWLTRAVQREGVVFDAVVIPNSANANPQPE